MHTTVSDDQSRLTNTGFFHSMQNELVPTRSEHVGVSTHQVAKYPRGYASGKADILKMLIVSHADHCCVLLNRRDLLRKSRCSPTADLFM